MQIRQLGLALAAAGALWVSPATAATYEITYTGVANWFGYDGSGVFGTPDTSLLGEAFTVVYRLNWPSPVAFYINDGTYSGASGGRPEGTPSFMSATVTIKGVTQAVSGNFENWLGRSNEDPNPSIRDSINNYIDQLDRSSPTSYAYREVSAFVRSQYNLTDDADFTSPLNYVTHPDDISDFTLIIENVVDGQMVEYAEVEEGTVLSVSVAQVPEPTTWALMILGFGATGAALRRERRTPARVRV